MDSPKLLVISGSARAGSYNLTLARYAAQRARAAGIQVEEFDLRALGLPIYDGELESASGVPEGAYQLQSAITRSNGLLLVTPEYNGFPTPLFINAFDWLSRIVPTAARPNDTEGLAATANKPAALLSASPGAAGGLRSMNYVRQYLQMAFQMIVVPQQFALGKANEAFDAQGALKDARAVQSVDFVISAWMTLAWGRMNG